MAPTLEEVRKLLAGEGDANLVRFAETLFERTDDTLTGTYGAAALSAMARQGLAFLASSRGETQVEVFNPDDQSGWSSPHTVVMLTLTDRPFIVDSVQAELRRRGRPLYHQLHPIMNVSRNVSGELLSLGDDEGGREAFELFFVERIDDADQRAALQAALEKVLADVVLATDDYEAMLKRSGEVEQYLEELAGAGVTGPLSVPREDLDEYAAFMKWLDEDNFVFLGFREYELLDVNGVQSLQVDTESGLGVLRKLEDSAYVKPVPVEQLPEDLRQRVTGGRLFIVTKANSEATVHRARRMDYVGVKSLTSTGEVRGERRFIGLFTTKGLSAPVEEVPILRLKLKQVLEIDQAIPGSHDYKAIVAAFNGMPREELFWSDAAQIHADIRTILRLEQEQAVRLTLRADPLKRGVAVMVIMPRERFSDEVRQKVQEYLTERLSASRVDSRLAIGEDEGHARFHFFFATDQSPSPALADELEQTVARLARSWDEELRALLHASHGEAEAARLAARYLPAFDDRYRADTRPERAVVDIGHLEKLSAVPHVIDLTEPDPSAAMPAEDAAVLEVYHRDHGLALSDVLPLLENLGFRVLEQNPYNLTVDGEHRGVDVYSVTNASGGPVGVEENRARIVSALGMLLARGADNDRLNRLVLHAGLTVRQVSLVRLYQMYYAQINSVISRAFVNNALLAHPEFAATLVRYFETKFDPALFGGAAAPTQERLSALAEIEQEFIDALADVKSLAEDQVLRGLLDLMKATVRASYFLDLPRLSIKIDSAKVGLMPEPRPMFEIAVASRGVEGAHLRGGRVARGGIRWSDRPDDFRTEVLGLLKTQTTKNAVIVPVGSKGGFVVKNAPQGPDLRDYVRTQYQTYIRGLLDLTDNLVEGAVVHPTDLVIYDDPDPYLVVAADKGTATFSDLANETAAEYGYWLDDAFASGGSAGYDHKGMGITARGAWEAVKRHFAEVGLDATKHTFTAAGIGDMSGDVFGNGMLYTDRIRLQAAFNHLHIFIDPDPDPDKGYAERKRLFELPRSTWDDYDRSLISEGGGIFERAAKSIPLSPQMREMLQVEAEALSGQELIKAVLRMPVDLLWNGGIGTYVKATDERHGEVGDTANDGVRVNGGELRARVVGEGGNLGFTQLGRIEYALSGGRIDTDAIDNSAGVDSSDHEVNIKILLQPLTASGSMSGPDRNALLAEMTDEVARLVLRHNHDQARALSLAQRADRREPALYASLLEYLVESAGLNPRVEFLPSARQLEERRLAGEGFTRPELSVMLAYVKMGLYSRLLETELPSEPHLQHYLHEYFPHQLRDRHPDAIDQHRLKAEITATVITNTLVDNLGLAFVHRAMRDNGASAIDVVRATLIALEVMDALPFFNKMEELGPLIGAEAQYAAILEMVFAVQGVVSWMLFNNIGHGDFEHVVSSYRAPLAELRAGLRGFMPAGVAERFDAKVVELSQLGLDHATATDIVGLEYLPTGFGVIQVSKNTGTPLPEAAARFFELGERLSLGWLRDELSDMESTGPWEKIALTDLVMDLRDVQQRLTATYFKGQHAGTVEEFLKPLSALDRYDRALSEMRNTGSLDLAAGTVMVRLLRQAEGAAARGRGRAS